MMLLSLLLASAAAAELTFKATAVQNGQTTAISPEEIVKTAPRSRPHGIWGSANSSAVPPPTGSQQKRQKSARSGTVTMSPGWCGLSQRYEESNDPITSVFGAFTAPDVYNRTGTYPQFAAAWVGIDGWSCTQALLQAGVTTTLNSHGEQSVQAWFEWYPEGSYNVPYSSLTVMPGDWIEVNVTATSATEGQITIYDINQGVEIGVTLENGPALCRQDADWIVEDFESDGEEVPFARFDNLWFEECSATSAKGNSIGLNGAQTIYLGTSTSNALCAAEPYDNSDFVCVSEN